MANDLIYDAVLSRAMVHMQAWDAFRDDPTMPWRAIAGNVPRERTKAWVDALKQTLNHQEQIERSLS
jgi:hypothetical protein